MSRKYRTGFCSIGLCEGTKPRSPSGKPLKTCEFWMTCGCKCHAEITAMFEATGNDRVTVYNPEYSPERSQYWTPGLSEITAPEQPQEHVQMSEMSDLPDLSENVRPEFRPTPTGRKARGELEFQVAQVIGRWLSPDSDLEWEFCTPVLVAQAIDEAHPPSTGAINAVFSRWEKLGFADIAKKPIRFVSFTHANGGAPEALQELRERVRREKKKAASRLKRGVRT